ncbi:MAG: response regulator [Desulfobacteraceae bacterium]|nr:response regulator [Desulfobacteraceae bacterium]
MNVLIVDDSKVMCMNLQKIYSQFLHNADFIIHHSSEDAEQSMGNIMFDFASLDVNLPGKDGFELAKYLRGISLNTKIAMVTGNRQDVMLQKARDLNAMLIQKPLKKEEKNKFIQSIENMLKKWELI